MSFKSDFPIFQNHPDIVYLDNTASVHKPQMVIDAMSHFFANDYANIHRGAYDLSDRSEELYNKAKKSVADLIGVSLWREISFHYNATYALNFLSLSLAYSGILKRGDRVLLSIAEHHANIVPWLILKKWIGIEVDFFGLRDDFSIDFSDLASKLTPKTKVVAMTAASNITGAIFDLESAGKLLKEYQKVDFSDTIFTTRNHPIFIVDASQAVPNFAVNVEQIGADALFFTGHKMMSDTGLGVLWGKQEFLKLLTPAIGGGGAINFVDQQGYAPAGLPEKMEPGTPHIAWAVSLLAAIEYIEKIGGYDVIENAEKPLIEAMLAGFEKLADRVQLIGPKTSENRIGVFSFIVPGKHPTDIADALAEKNICVRAGFHCAEPLSQTIDPGSADRIPSVRTSIYFYNDLRDVERFFEALEPIIGNKSEIGWL